VVQNISRKATIMKLPEPDIDELVWKRQELNEWENITFSYQKSKYLPLSSFYDSYDVPTCLDAAAQAVLQIPRNTGSKQ
jgi:hypothetical protein